MKVFLHFQLYSVKLHLFSVEVVYYEILLVFISAPETDTVRKRLDSVEARAIRASYQCSARSCHPAEWSCHHSAERTRDGTHSCCRIIIRRRENSIPRWRSSLDSISTASTTRMTILLKLQILQLLSSSGPPSLSRFAFHRRSSATLTATLPRPSQPRKPDVARAASCRWCPSWSGWTSESSPRWLPRGTVFEIDLTT